MTTATIPTSTSCTVTHNGVTAFTYDQTGVLTGVDAGVRSLTASITTNAITVILDPTTIDFRNTTLTNGATTQIQVPAAISLVIAATDSFALVTASGKQRIAILAINNAGTVELAASAIYGGAALDETGVITTAIASTTATGIKAGAARTGVAYRVVGFVDATFTTATGWGSLALVQGQGGNAASAMGSLGYGQTWQNVTVSRALATTYYNTTGRAILVSAQPQATTNGTSTLIVNGVSSAATVASGNLGLFVSAIVPAGGSYIVDNNQPSKSLIHWAELR